MSQSKQIASVEVIATAIANDWKEVLDLESVEVTDHFLDLGGDSLQAMHCATKIHERFGIELSLQDFFLDDATVIGMARTIHESLTLDNLS